MGEDTEQSAFEIIIKLLAKYGVEYIVIGGQAESLHGSARVTFDTDLCYRRTAENLDRLAKALQELQPTLRGAPADLPFRIDAQSLALGCNFTFNTSAGPLDLLGYVEPLGGYDEVISHAETIEIGGIAVNVVSLDDLIRIKEHIRRPKDQDSLRNLLAIRKLREEGGENAR